MNKYIIKSKGYFNPPSITSTTIGYSRGYKPIYEGGCFAIVPHNNKFILFGEDDDHYFEEQIITRSELIQLQQILSDIDTEIDVKIDYIKAKSVHTFAVSKDFFLNKERSVGKWLVSVEDRGEDTAPLVIIENIKKDRFDVSHTKARLKVINDVLKII